MFLFSARVPGSLSDRWSSLATIYPLRFHEIFGRWLSYNIKPQSDFRFRRFSAETKQTLHFDGFYLIKFYVNYKIENSYRKELA